MTGCAYYVHRRLAKNKVENEQLTRAVKVPHGCAVEPRF